MRTTSIFITTFALAACGDNLQPPSETPPPAGGRTITGSQIVSYRHLDSTLLSESPTDLFSTVIEAHVPDGDGWRVVPGTGHRDGSFVIDGVADGAVWVRAARRPYGDSFYWTDAEHVSFDESVLGAEEPAIADEGDRLGISVSGLDAWQDGDELAWFVPDDDVFSTNLVWERSPAIDATAFETAVDWSWRPLADIAPGDAAHLVQYRTRELAAGVAVRAPLRAAQPTLKQQAGVEGTLSVALTTPSVLDYHLAWARDVFEAERTAAHPSRAGASYGHGFALIALPGHVGGDLWLGAEYPVATLADPSLLDGTTPLDLGTLAIPNPYPREWLADLYVVTFPVDFPLPDGTPMTLEAALGRRSAELTTAGPARPLVTAIRMPRLAGGDAYTPQGGVGLTPELTWQPPATGTPTSYRVQIIEAVTHPPEPFRPGWYVAAELMVPGNMTSLRVPADVLRPGATYGMVVRTFSEPGQDVALRPFQVRGTAGIADTILGPFSP